MGFGISLFTSVGSYYTYGVAPLFSVFDEHPRSLTRTLVSDEYHPHLFWVSHDATLLIIRYLYNLSKTLSLSL